jgi:hypothetical protein
MLIVYTIFANKNAVTWTSAQSSCACLGSLGRAPKKWIIVVCFLATQRAITIQLIWDTIAVAIINIINVESLHRICKQKCKQLGLQPKVSVLILAPSAGQHQIGPYQFVIT